MKYIFGMLFVFIAFTVMAQVPVVVNPNMIEISWDGIVWQDATTYVANIAIVTGTTTVTHVKHTRRGEVNKWEGQLGAPVAADKVTFDVNTALIPIAEHRYYIRFMFGMEEPAGTLRLSLMSDSSDVVQFIGKPFKPKRKD